MQQVRDWLSAASSVAVLTGAGISAESGIPTFRSAAGLWRSYRPEELATPQAFARDPLLVWEWYQWRRELIARAGLNPGHLALASLEQRISRFLLITQNVDGMHDRAGNRRIVKLHGDIWYLRCVECSREWEDHRPRLPALPPRCDCGGLARPGVVWFGEALPALAWEEAERAARSSAVLLVVGTSGVVYPAAHLISIARTAGARVVEINLEDTAQSGNCDAVLRGRSGDLLPQLVA